MNILVCIKQVPDTADIKWTKNNTLQRDGMDSIINPFDEYALETALKIKDSNTDTKITVISMGPKQVNSAIKNAIACGCDDGILICDKKFSGSDTIATSKTISAAISKVCPEFDLIICGQFATDGDTAQTGPGIAENLNLPQATFVRKITEFTNESIIVEKETDFGIEVLKLKLPALICVQKCDYEIRNAKINGYIYAQNKEIKTVNFDDTGLNEDQTGIKGSPTYVSKAFPPESNRNFQLIDIDKLTGILKEKAYE